MIRTRTYTQRLRGADLSTLQRVGYIAIFDRGEYLGMTNEQIKRECKFWELYLLEFRANKRVSTDMKCFMDFYRIMQEYEKEIEHERD